MSADNKPTLKQICDKLTKEVENNKSEITGLKELINKLQIEINNLSTQKVKNTRATKTKETKINGSAKIKLGGKSNTNTVKLKPINNWTKDAYADTTLKEGMDKVVKEVLGDKFDDVDKSFKEELEKLKTDNKYIKAKRLDQLKKEGTIYYNIYVKSYVNLRNKLKEYQKDNTKKAIKIVEKEPDTDDE